MGANPTLRTLSDIQRLGGALRVTCRKCRRSVVFEIRGMVEYFYGRGLNSALEVAGEHFRCEKCGAKGAMLDLEPPPEKHVFPKPRPTDLQLRQEARRRR